MAESVCPFVYWSQTKSTLRLKIDLRDVEEPDLTLEPEQVTFRARAVGNSGTRLYAFTVDFYQSVLPKETKYQLGERSVEMTFVKEGDGWWPHVQRERCKLPWLKVDFERWRTESDDEADKGDVVADYPGVYDQLLREETGRDRQGRLENFRESYLIMYNLWQLLGYAVILGKLALRYHMEGADSITKAYDTAGTNMKFTQALQVLEILHPLLGMTRGGALEPLMQVGGRNLMLFVLLEGEPRLQTKPAVFYLFVVWSLVELIRYPFYVCRLVRRDLGLLTWLRYTIWIPLYPAGFITEGVLYLRSLPYYEETGRFTVSLPNPVNFAFHFPTFIQALMVCAFLPGFLVMMRHMHQQRDKVLGGRRSSSKVKSS